MQDLTSFNLENAQTVAAAAGDEEQTMNMINPENFAELRQDGTSNPVLARLMKAWEDKMAKNAKRAGGFGLVAVSLAACGGDSDDNGNGGPIDPPPVDGQTLFLSGVFPMDLLTALGFAPGLGTGFTSVSGVTSFLQELTDSLNENLLLVTTPEKSNATVGMKRTGDGDDVIIGTSFNFNGMFIDGGDGNDTLELAVSTSAFALGVVNVENVLLGNQTPTLQVSTIDLFSVIDLEQLTITQDIQNAGTMNVAGVRNAADLTFSGSFSGPVNVDYVLGVSAINVTLENVTARQNPLTVSHEGGAVNLVSTGGIAVNVVDEANFGFFLQTLTITGGTPLQLGVPGTPGSVALPFRPTDPATIDASGAAGVTIVAAPHNNMTFTGSAANDVLVVQTAPAIVGPDTLITLNVEMGGGANTLRIVASAGGMNFVTPDSSIAATGGTLDVVVSTSAAASTIDMSQNGGAIDVSAFGTVTIDTNTTLNLTSAQVATIGIENFVTPDFGNQSGALNITAVGDELLDLSAIDVGQIVTITTQTGEVTFNPDSILGNANAGVGAIIIDTRGSDSSLTMTGAQFAQLGGPIAVGGIANQLITVPTTGTNNPALGQPYEPTLTLTDIDTNTNYNLTGVFNFGAFGGAAPQTATTQFALTDFTAGPGFDITFVSGTNTVVLVVSGAVDLSGAASALGGVNAIVVEEGGSLTLSAAQINAIGAENIEGASEITIPDAGATVNITSGFGANTAEVDLSGTVFNFTGAGAHTVNVTGDSDVTKGVAAGPDSTGVTVTNSLAAGATLSVTGGSAAVALGGTAASTLTVNTVNGAETIFGAAEGEPSISGDNLQTINVNNFSGVDTTVDLGTLDVASDTLTVTNAAPATTTVIAELTEVPAGAVWTFTDVNVVIGPDAVIGEGARIVVTNGNLTVEDGATFEAGAALTLGGTITVDGSFPLGQLPLTSDSILPIDASLTVEQISGLLEALSFNSATINVTGMSNEQLKAIAAQSLKVASMNGDFLLTNGLTVDEVNKVIPLYAANAQDGDLLTVNANGMNPAQLNTAGAFVGAPFANAVDFSVVNLVLVSGVNAGAIGNLTGAAAANTVQVEADGMNAAQLNALVPSIENVAIINDMVLTAGNGAGQITALLSKSPVDGTVVNAAGMGNDQLSALVEQIAKVDVINNLTVTNAQTQVELDTLLGQAVDATVNAANMSIAKLAIVDANIANVDSIVNLTVTNELTPEQIGNLMAATADGSVDVQLSGMSVEQVGAVTANIDKVGAVNVAANTTVTLTPAQVTTFADAGLAINGQNAQQDGDTGGSIIVQQASGTGTLNLGNVNPGTNGGFDAAAGTLTLDIGGGARINVEPSAETAPTSVTGTGTLGIAGGTVNFGTADVDIAGGITIELAPSSGATASGVLTLRAVDAAELAANNVTITKPAAAPGEVTGSITALGGNNLDATAPVNLSALNLSKADLLIVGDPQGTVLPTNAANLPGAIGTTANANFVLVQATSNWAAFDGAVTSQIRVAPDATLSLDVGVVESMLTAVPTFIKVLGQNATAAGQTGGSLVITGLDGDVYNLALAGSRLVAGTDGGIGTANAGTVSLAVTGNVTLNSETILPTAGGNVSIDVATGATLTVDGEQASHASNNYAGGGKVVFSNLINDTAGTTVTALNADTGENDVRFVDFVLNEFEAGDLPVTINGWSSATSGGLNGQFAWDGTQLGLMRVDVTDFDTNGSAVVRNSLANIQAVENLADAGVVIVTGGTTLAGLLGQSFAAVNGTDAQLVFAVTGPANNTQLVYWNDADGNGNGVVNFAELTVLGTLNSADGVAPLDLAASNFVA